MKNFNLSINIGNSINNSHVFIDGQEIPVTSLKVEIEPGSFPKIEMGVMPHNFTIEGEMEAIADGDGVRALIEHIIIEGKRIYKKEKEGGVENNGTET